MKSSHAKMPAEDTLELRLRQAVYAGDLEDWFAHELSMLNVLCRRATLRAPELRLRLARCLDMLAGYGVDLYVDSYENKRSERPSRRVSRPVSSAHA